MKKSKDRKASSFFLRTFLSAIIFSAVNYGQAQDLKIQVDKKGKIGFVNQDGTEVIKCQYDSAYPFEDGYAIVSKSGKYGIIDMQKDIKVDFKYAMINYNEKAVFIINEEDEKKFRREALIWVCTNILK